MKLDIKSFILGLFVFALFAFTSQEILTYKPAKPIATVSVLCYTGYEATNNISKYVKLGYQVKLYHSSSHSSYGLLIMEKY